MTVCRHCGRSIYQTGDGWLHEMDDAGMGRCYHLFNSYEAEPADEPKATLCRHCGEEIAPRHYTHVAGDEPRCSEHGPFAAPADKPTAALTQADVWVQMAWSLERIADALEKRT